MPGDRAGSKQSEGSRPDAASRSVAPRHHRQAAAAQRRRSFGAEVALREKAYGIWHAYSWADSRQQVEELALGLLAQGVARGDVVGIIGRNRPHWLWAELAAHAVGAMSLGIYEDALGTEVQYLLGYAEAKVVLRRGRGAGRQGARDRGPAAGAALDRLQRPARPAQIRRPPPAQPRAADRARQSGCPPGASSRWSPRAAATRSRCCARPRARPPIPSSRCCSIGRCSSTSPPICAPSRASRPTSTSRSCRCPGSSSRSTSR